jgi:hypothetical protein
MNAARVFKKFGTEALLDIAGGTLGKRGLDLTDDDRDLLAASRVHIATLAPELEAESEDKHAFWTLLGAVFMVGVIAAKSDSAARVLTAAARKAAAAARDAPAKQRQRQIESDAIAAYAGLNVTNEARLKLVNRWILAARGAPMKLRTFERRLSGKKNPPL